MEDIAMYVYKRRVKFYETDGMQVVHHANYLRYFEEARVEYLREGKLDLTELMDEGIVFPIVEVDVKYHQSARYDEVLLIKTYLRKVDRARLVFEYEVVSEKSGALLTTGHTVNTYTDMHTGRIVRLPKEKLTALIDLSKGDRE